MKQALFLSAAVLAANGQYLRKTAPVSELVRPTISERPILDGIPERPILNGPIIGEPTFPQKPIIDRIPERPILDGPIIDEPTFPQKPIIDRIPERPILDGPILLPTDKPLRPIIDRIPERPILDGPILTRPIDGIPEQPILDGPIIDEPVLLPTDKPLRPTMPDMVAYSEIPDLSYNVFPPFNKTFYDLVKNFTQELNRTGNLPVFDGSIPHVNLTIPTRDFPVFDGTIPHVNLTIPKFFDNNFPVFDGTIPHVNLSIPDLSLNVFPPVNKTFLELLNNLTRGLDLPPMDTTFPDLLDNITRNLPPMDTTLPDLLNNLTRIYNGTIPYWNETAIADPITRPNLTRIFNGTIPYWNETVIVADDELTAIPERLRPAIPERPILHYPNGTLDFITFNDTINNGTYSFPPFNGTISFDPAFPDRPIFNLPENFTIGTVPKPVFKYLPDTPIVPENFTIGPVPRPIFNHPIARLIAADDDELISLPKIFRHKKQEKPHVNTTYHLPENFTVKVELPENFTFKPLFKVLDDFPEHIVPIDYPEDAIVGF